MVSTIKKEESIFTEKLNMFGSSDVLILDDVPSSNIFLLCYNKYINKLPNKMH